MNRIALALALVRGDISPEAGRAQLAKSVATVEGPPDDDDIVKGGGGKPPAGFTAVPGGAHGGFRKRNARGGYTYWYPSTDAAKQAAEHHKNERSKWLDDASRRHHIDAEFGAKEFVERKESAAKERAQKKQREASYSEVDAARAAGTDKPTEGKHRIANRDGAAERDTIESHGLYHVGGEAVRSGTGRGNAKHSYTVTHGPTGMVAYHAKTKKEAVDAAKHFHAHAGDAGHDAAFGKPPDKAAMARLQGAYTSLVTGAARKSIEEWHPEMSLYAPEGDLVKAFSDLSGTDHMGVAENAFEGLAAPNLRKGGGDTDLRGIGAGFDPRWNGGMGVGDGRE